MNNESETHPITRSLAAVVRGICSQPQDLQVIEKETGNFLEVTFQPNMQDIRVLIGKGWRQKNALVTVAAAMGRRMDTLTEFTISDSDCGDKDDPKPTPRNGSFTKEQLVEMIRPVIHLALGPDVAWKVFGESDRFKVEVYASESDAPVVTAVGDLFFAIGKAHGTSISVCYKHLNKAR